MSKRAREIRARQHSSGMAWNESGKVYGYSNLHDDLLDQGEA